VYLNIISITLLLSFAVITWLGSRRYGVMGMVGVQLLGLIGYFIIAWLATCADRYEYDGMMSIFGLLFQAFVINSLLLPLAMVALWRRRWSARNNLR
jgi:hypothetical protein